MANSESTIVREFVRTENCGYLFAIHTSGNLMINDYGMVRGVITGLSAVEQENVHQYLSAEYSFKEYKYISRYGRVNFQIYPISTHFALERMFTFWSKIFSNEEAVDDFKSIGLVSPFLEDIADTNRGRNIPFDYSAKHNCLPVVEIGPNATDMINGLNIIQCKEWLGLSDPAAMKPFFELYNRESFNSRSCKWITDHYHWEDDLSRRGLCLDQKRDDHEIRRSGKR